jgi:vitamin B12 transporter
LKHILFILAMCFFFFSTAYSQEEKKKEKEASKAKELPELTLIARRILNVYRVDSSHVYLTQKQIEDLQADDLGELLKKIPGVNVKAYGGLGALKTVSIRGLSGQHTTMVVDGFVESNSQTGLTNMGQIHLDNVESVIVQRGGSAEVFIPTTAQLSGNAVLLSSFEAATPSSPLQQKLYTKFGSFGHIDHHYIVKTGNKKIFGGLQFKYRQANGAYPFRFMNYQTEIKGTRKNNDYKDLNGGANLHYRINDKHALNFYFRYFDAEQGVPGAVVLYNDFANQRLANRSAFFQTDYKGVAKGIHYRFFYTHNRDSLHYLDPSYLNSVGKLQSSYQNFSHDFGVNIGTTIVKRLDLNIGLQEIISKLRSQESFAASPLRMHFASFVKINYKDEKWAALGQLGFQHIKESDKEGISAKNRTRLTPYLELRFVPHKKINFLTYYRNSFRMPNFNELYYNNVGNSNLKPEDAHQFNLTTSWTILDKNRSYLGLQLSAYYNRLNNMILSIPTKNLFTWSVQNIGKNEVKGLDAILSYSVGLGKKWQAQISANYTLQESLDISDKNSPTYKHLVAYSPLHLFNGDLTVQYNGFGLRLSSFYSSSRYALNENIPSNLVQGFTNFDLAIYSKHELGEHNSIRLQITMKNVTNASFAYVKSFIMPGRHYLFTFIYAFI